MPHYRCTVCNRTRPEDRSIGQEHEEIGWVCLDCLHHYTFEALRMIANLNVCSNCSIRGTSMDGGPFGPQNDWYCDDCTYSDLQAAGLE